MLKNLGHTMLIMAAVALPIFSWGDAPHVPFGGNRALAQEEDELLTDQLSFTVENFTEYTLQEFYVSPTVEPDDWGTDRLGDDVVLPGETREILVDESRDDCLYDVRGVFSGESYEQVIDEYQVDLCINEGTYTYYDDADRVFNVVNQTSVELVEFYFTPTSREDWGEDLLGNEVIAPGESVDIPVNSSECEYDFKAVFADGDELEQPDINVCEGDGIVFSEDGQ